MDHKNSTKKMRHLGQKISLTAGCLLILSIAVVVTICISMFYTLIMNMLRDQCVHGTNMLAWELDEYVGPEDKSLMLDDLKEELGCEFTIFHGDERAYTTIMQDGERVIGTKLSDELAEIVLKKGQSYIGNASILGVKHLCSYVPTKDENGQINGLIFAGISTQSAYSQLNRTVTASIISGGAMLVLCIVLMSIFVRYTVTRPLSKLTDLARTMEQGNLGLESGSDLSAGIRSSDEIGLLAEIFERMIRRLKGYIGEISTILESISDGNLATGTTQDYTGDFTSIKNSLDGILSNLSSTMSQIVESSEHVSNGSRQMAAGSQALSQGAVEQAGAVEELEQSISDISKRVEETAANASQASRKVDAVGSQIFESNQKMHQMIVAMHEINNCSSEIEKIIKTIETIASQTNILALNAAVEAARAGSAGKGFAVVADEVRNLAGKSAEASKNTSALIENTLKAVENGTLIADETAISLSKTVKGVEEVSGIISNISEASSNQASAISQITMGIDQISSVVQTNSATAEESAAASEELSSQSQLMKELVGRFRLKG